MNTVQRVLLTIVVWFLCFIPIEIVLFIRYLSGAKGFWENFVVLGFGMYFLGAFQLVLLIVAVAATVVLWSD